MNNKPMILTNEDMAEGIYAASGDGCYTTTAYIHQKPETGRGDYRIQVDAKHHADHTKDVQWLHISFNKPVVYVSCNANGAQLESGNGSTTLVIRMTYHQNPTDNIGFGDLIVTADAGLAITGQYTVD